MNHDQSMSFGARSKRRSLERGCAPRVSRSAWLLRTLSDSANGCGGSATQPSSALNPNSEVGPPADGSAGFQTCCIADFQVGRPRHNQNAQKCPPIAGLETRDTAGLEVCATNSASEFGLNRCGPASFIVIACLLLGFHAGARTNASGQSVYPVTQAPPAAPLPAASPQTWQTSYQPAPPPSQSAGFSAADLESLARPIALHPDPLVAVILPASVYPLEIAQAARFVKDTNNLARLAEQPWDDKVKAVAQYPEVIAMMDADIAWTTKLGQAFLNQPMDLMNAIQSLRGKAQANGALKTTPQQVVNATNAVVERMYEGKIVYVTNTVIEVQPASTNVVYVPTYNPSTVYVDDNDGVEAVVGFGVALGMTAIIANNCDWYYGGCYWGHYPPPPPYYPPPYHPPPGTQPPTGGRPPGERPPGERPPGNRPGDRPPSASQLPAQRWQPDQSRLNSAGAPATAQSREARGWGGASTQPAQRDVAGGAGRTPSGTGSAWQPTASDRVGSTPGTAQSRPGGAGTSPRVGDRSTASPSFDRGGARNTSAFSGVNSGSGARNYSSRGATSRSGGGGGARGGGRGR
jgi:uncharacterized membrane protein YgcG